MRILSSLVVTIGLCCTSNAFATGLSDISVGGTFSNSSYGDQRAPFERREPEGRYYDEGKPIRSSNHSSVAHAAPQASDPVPPIPEKAPAERTAQKAVNGAIVNTKPAEYIDGRRELKCLTKDTRHVFLKTEAEFGKMEIVSTCVVKTIRGTGRMSQHSYGRAIDFNAPKGRKKEVVQWLIKHKKELGANGVMTYSNFDHIHVDTGPYRFTSLGAHG